MTTKNKLMPAARSVTLLLLVIFAQWACTKKEIKTIPAPVISGVSKSTAHVGDTLTITGTGFSAVAAEDIVAISSTSLKVIQASATQLVGVIPTAAQGGQLTVGLVGGPSATWPTNILIIGGIQPYITSVSPASAFVGDTLIIHGGNFGLPASSNNVLIGGVVCTILNVSDSVIRLSVTEMAHTGNLTVTTNGSTSLPVPFSVQRPNPLADGRLYWESGINNPFSPGSANVLRGADSVFSIPYSTTVYQNNTVDEFYIPYASSVLSGNSMDPMPADAQGNSYFLYNALQYGSPTTQFQLIRLGPGPVGSFTHTVLWNQDFGSNGASLIYPNPSDSNTYIYAANTPDNLSIDGNKMYIKFGITNSFYTADLSAPSPVFTTITGLVPDSLSFGVQFGANYIFYKTVGSDNNYSLDLITQVKYMSRGSSSAQAIPLPSDETILTTLADNRHGDNILIITQTNAAPSATKIYKFNAATQTLQPLYGPSNWVDAVPGANYYGNPNLGFIWAGNHIYYANAAHHTDQTTGLYLLNDDGSSTRVLNVYPRLELPGTSIYNGVALFLGKN